MNIPSNVIKEIPKRMLRSLTYACKYYVSRTEYRLIALTNDYKLYELRDQNINFGIDLSETVIKNMQLGHYQEESSLSKSLPGTSSQENMESIIFGKYFFYKARQKILYLLLKVFDKLIIILRSDDGLKFQTQYSNVEYFEVVDSDYTYQAKVAIYLKGQQEPILTNFENEESDSNGPDSLKQIGNEVFQTLQERIENLNVELSIQKEVTAKRFIEVQNQLVFGPNHIRSDRIEEKQCIAQYGDVWMKFNNDQLVIGIPIINKSSKRLITLQNVRPVLICHERESFEYEYELYLLNDDSYTFENYDELLENEEKFEKSFSFNEEWLPEKESILRPENSAIVVVKTKLTEFINYSSYEYKCFIVYDIVSDGRTYTLQFFIKNICVQPKVLYDNEFQLTMDSRDIYKDLLTMTATMGRYELHIKYTHEVSPTKLSQFIIEKLGFNRIQKRSASVKMEIDDEQNFHTSEVDTFFHKQNASSYWFGTLIRLDGLHENSHRLKIYTKNEDKLFAFAQILYNDFEEKCIVLPFGHELASPEAAVRNVRQFQDSLRKEIDMSIKFYETNSTKTELNQTEVLEFQKKLFSQELETDLAYMNVL